jgi:hypothetical protein
MNTESTQPQFGPFADREVSIYCDESRHEGQASQPYMVIGGLWLPREKRTEIQAGLREIQVRHSVTGELKWGKVSRAKLAGYQAAVDFIAARPDVHFRCIVVDKSKADSDKYFKNDRQFGPKATQEKKRIFVTLDKGLSYFISLVYTEHGLALGTAFPPDGQWLRKMEADSMRISP